MSDLEKAKATAVALGLAPEDGEGAFLAQDYMSQQAPAEVRDLSIIETEILFYKRQAGESILEIGKRLNEAKAQLGHGQWLPWLKEKVDISERSAQNFMKLAKEYEKSAEIADLGATKALTLLALSDSERREFVAEAHEVNGEEKTVEEMTNRELKQAIEERDQARKAAEEAKADQQTAEEARRKMEEDVRHLKELASSAQEAEAQHRAELNQARQELADLRAKPVEVAVETRDASPEQIEQAKQEARAEAEKEIKTAQAKAELAEQELKRARERAKEANERALKAQADRDQAEKKAQEAEGKARLHNGESMVRFGVLFNSTQDLVNQMAELMDAEAVENRMRMEKALGALADQIGKVAGL